MFESILHQPLRFDEPTWNLISNEAKDFIARILCKDPAKRATVPELLVHPWLADTSQHRKPAPDAPVPDAVVTRLQQFASMNRFKKEARKVLVALLPEEEVRHAAFITLVLVAALRSVYGQGTCSPLQVLWRRRPLQALQQNPSMLIFC